MDNLEEWNMERRASSPVFLKREHHRVYKPPLYDTVILSEVRRQPNAVEEPLL